MNAKSKIFITTLFFFGILITGMTGFAVVEDMPFSDALYFTIVTVATVGYGDIHPVTQAGKFLAVIIIITGTGTFLTVIAYFTEKALAQREKRDRFKKLNVIIGIFFNEIGNRLLGQLSANDRELSTIEKSLSFEGTQTDKEYMARVKAIEKHPCSVDAHPEDLKKISDFLQDKRSLLLEIMANPNLLEHESFTDMLMSVFHVMDELSWREDFGKLPEIDRKHLKNDLHRSYRQLMKQWILYMSHLKQHYPYLYSMAVRTNPFARKIDVIINK